MKKLIVLVVLLAGGFAGYRYHEARQAPIRTFTSFADALAKGRHDLAARYAEGDAADGAQGERYRQAGWVPVENLRGISYAVHSRAESPDGREVKLDVTQTVGFNPPGVESALRPAMKARFHQTATVRRTPAGWKVVAFKSEFLAADETR